MKLGNIYQDLYQYHWLLAHLFIDEKTEAQRG